MFASNRMSTSIRTQNGFTFIELLVTSGIILVLLGLLIPGLSQAREQSRIALCQSNIRELAWSNDMYAKDYRGVYVPGASEFLANLHRWHGERLSVAESFRPTNSPLAVYYGPTGEIRACPSFQPEHGGFESGCGGYGYNNAYVGVQGVTKPNGRFWVTSDRAGTYADKINQPGRTLMFSDAAFATEALIEYSFAEPRFHPQYGMRADPSIHFRHLARANIAWCDGHITRERQTFTWTSGIYPADPARFHIGWFGESDDNTFFDLR